MGRGRGGACKVRMRIGIMEDNFVLGNILHFGQYPNVQLGYFKLGGVMKGDTPEINCFHGLFLN